MIHELIIKGLKQSQHVEDLVRQKIHDLLDAAPSDASASAILNKVNEGYEGLLEIFSSQGKFVARAVGQNINDLFSLLGKDIHHQLKEWRGCRFQITKTT